ncbi:MAG: hypothetical protein P4L92_01180 [Rudaea sp.]|nr:hypothetical protein [Rudaea sp.]
MNRLIKIIAGIAIIIVVPKIVQHIMLPDNKAIASKQITDVVNETNKSLPKKIDAITTLTKAEFDGSIYRINYTMDRGVKIDPAQEQTYRAVAVKKICGSGMKMILDNQVTIEYLYTFNPDGRGDQKMAISVPPDSCGR